MRFIKQLLIILGVTFAGEALHFLLPLPVPASIYGLVLMLLCLCFKVFPLRAVEETGDFLIDLMPASVCPRNRGRHGRLGCAAAGAVAGSADYLPVAHRCDGGIRPGNTMGTTTGSKTSSGGEAPCLNC